MSVLCLIVLTGDGGDDDDDDDDDDGTTLVLMFAVRVPVMQLMNVNNVERLLAVSRSAVG